MGRGGGGDEHPRTPSSYTFVMIMIDNDSAQIKKIEMLYTKRSNAK